MQSDVIRIDQAEHQGYTLFKPGLEFQEKVYKYTEDTGTCFELSPRLLPRQKSLNLRLKLSLNKHNPSHVGKLQRRFLRPHQNSVPTFLRVYSRPYRSAGAHSSVKHSSFQACADRQSEESKCKSGVYVYEGR